MDAWGFDIIRTVMGLSRKLENLTNRLFRRIGTTASQGKVMMYLHLVSGTHDVFQRELEYALGIRASSINGLLYLLERDGFIRKELVAEDARKRKIALTPRGKEVLQELLQVRQKLIHELVETMSQPELQAFFRTCNTISKCTDKLYAGIGKFIPEDPPR